MGTETSVVWEIPVPLYLVDTDRDWINSMALWHAALWVSTTVPTWGQLSSRMKQA